MILRVACIDVQTTRGWGPLGKRAGDHLGEPGWSRRQKYTTKAEQNNSTQTNKTGTTATLRYSSGSSIYTRWRGTSTAPPGRRLQCGTMTNRVIDNLFGFCVCLCLRACVCVTALQLRTTTTNSANSIADNFADSIADSIADSNTAGYRLQATGLDLVCLRVTHDVACLREVAGHCCCCCCCCIATRALL